MVVAYLVKLLQFASGVYCQLAIDLQTITDCSLIVLLGGLRRFFSGNAEASELEGHINKRNVLVRGEDHSTQIAALSSFQVHL